MKRLKCKFTGLIRGNVYGERGEAVAPKSGEFEMNVGDETAAMLKSFNGKDYNSLSDVQKRLVCDLAIVAGFVLAIQERDKFKSEPVACVENYGKIQFEIV